MNKPKDHLIVAVILSVVVVGLLIVGRITGWDLDFMAGFLVAVVLYELEVFVAAMRRFPKFTARVLRGKRQDIEAINSSLTTYPTIYEEMGGMP